MGPVLPSLNKNIYFLTILDDFSRYGWVLFLQHKNETFNKFIIWYKEVLNILSIKIKNIRSDNGREFFNNNFKIFCQNNGIIHQYTIPYNPTQNWKAERFNRILISSAKALLNESKLSHDFWEFAVDTVNYIHNRLPHQGINNKIPFENSLVFQVFKMIKFWTIVFLVTFFITKIAHLYSISDFISKIIFEIIIT